MDEPLISVLVPIYNVGQYLRQCVDSVLAQTLGDIEVILIDDGSTDGCAAIVDEYARADGRVRAVHKPNSGYGDSLNRGLDRARGEWVSIIEPDDWVEATMFEHLVDAAARHGSAGRRVDIAKADYWRVVHKPGESPREVPSFHAEAVKPPRQPFTIDECPVLFALHPSIWSALFRRSFLDEFGIRFPPVPGAGWADNPFFAETMVAARGIVFLDEPVYHYREFEDGTLSHLKDWRIIFDRWREMNGILEKYDVAFPGVLEAHADRGCGYLQMLARDFDQDDPDLRAAERAMVAAIDFDTVRRSSMIPDEYKRAYAGFLPRNLQAHMALSRAAGRVGALLPRLP